MYLVLKDLPLQSSTRGLTVQLINMTLWVPFIHASATRLTPSAFPPANDTALVYYQSITFCVTRIDNPRVIYGLVKVAFLFVMLLSILSDARLKIHFYILKTRSKSDCNT